MSSPYTSPQIIAAYLVSVFVFITGLLSGKLWICIAILIALGILLGITAILNRNRDKQKFTNVCTPNYA